MLDGLDLENDEIRLFAVGRSRKGKTVVRRVQLSLADLQREGELWTVSRLWVMGHLGGVPDVSGGHGLVALFPEVLSTRDPSPCIE